MTDSTFPIFSLPQEILTFMASYLNPEELAQFRQVCRAFNTLGSQSSFMQPHYNRLKALDPTLPALLPTDLAPPLAFKQAFEKIRDAQIKEITCLTKRHPTIVTQHISAALALPPTTIEELEQRNNALDAINSALIERLTHGWRLNSTALILNLKYITRLPISLLKKPDLAQFWQNLTYLSCSHNALTTLNLQGLTALQYLYCDNNALFTINLKNCSTLQTLCCHNNPLAEVNLEGTPEKLRVKFAPLIEELLIKKLAQISLNQTPNFLPAFNDSAAPQSPQGFKRPPEENSEEEKSVTQDTDSKTKRQKP